MTVHLGRLVGGGCEAGTALIEMVMLRFAIVVIVVPTVTAVVGLADARARASAIAHDTAVAVARHGAEPDGTDTAIVDLTVSSSRVVAVATIDVTVISFLGREVTMSVSERASMAMSPYRSRR